MIFVPESTSVRRSELFVKMEADRTNNLLLGGGVMW